VAGIAWGTTGCATVQDVTSRLEREETGVYHKVAKGQTLWRIAQAYRVSLADIIISNNIPDAAIIEENQLIFIPGVEQVIALDHPQAADPDDGEFIWPVRGRILRYYGDRVGTQRSRGIRIATQSGQPVKAARRGKVVFADYLAGYDYTVILDHHDGYCSVYGKNSSLLVGVGETVNKGEQIAQASQDGDRSYVHFEIRKDTQADNPLYYLPQL